jgi:broad specificity phosphatase PhoE
MFLIRHGQSQFNVVYSVTRQDPGIEDPELTEEGHRQIEAVAAGLIDQRDRGEVRLTRLITSPYIRALQTAAILANALDVPVTVEALVRERAAFTCDVGSAPTALQQRFPRFAFAHLAHPWWHDLVAHGAAESEETLAERGASFRAAMRDDPDWSNIGVVTHWGFIRALTGQRVLNGAMVRLDR